MPRTPNASVSKADAKLSMTAEKANYQFSELFYNHNKDQYVYSELSGWYSYNEFNILQNHIKEPIGLVNKVSVFLQKYI